MRNEAHYIGTYKVVKIYRVSHRKQVLRRGLTREEAKRVVNSYKDSDSSMVVFCKQFTSSKYFVEKSINCSKVLQLMDKYFSYVDALNTVLKSDLSIDRVKLEKELNLYI